MPTRQQIVQNALKDNGLYDGVGYPGPSNKFDQWLGRPNEYSCADGVTYWFAVEGLPLPLMQQGMQGKQTGSSYCPFIVNYGRAHGAAIHSWQAQPADLVLFDWNGDGKADHIELAVGWAATGVLRTIGADSGPSNVDGHRGQGGVHLHDWHCPTNVGNSEILLVVNAAKLVTFSAPAPAPTHPTPPAWYHRELLLARPYMSGDDVKKVQGKVGAHVDGVYGPNTEGDVKIYQGHHGLQQDGVVGPITAEKMGP